MEGLTLRHCLQSDFQTLAAESWICGRSGNNLLDLITMNPQARVVSGMALLMPLGDGESTF